MQVIHQEIVSWLGQPAADFLIPTDQLQASDLPACLHGLQEAIMRLGALQHDQNLADQCALPPHWSGFEELACSLQLCHELLTLHTDVSASVLSLDTDQAETLHLLSADHSDDPACPGAS